MFSGSDLPDMGWLPFFVAVGMVATGVGGIALAVWIVRVFIYYFTGGAN